MPRNTDRNQPSPERAICAVMRLGDTTEIHYVDALPERGSRVHSASGQEWFVSEALQSGRNMYTVWCVGREEFLEDLETASSRGRVLAEDLVGLARRSVRASRSAGADDEAGSERTGRLRSYIAYVVDSEGRALRYPISAPSAAAAERQAREGAEEWGLTLVDVRLREEPPPDRPQARGRAGWVQSLFRRGGARPTQD